ncbi:transglutaminase-like domain-containing protein [Gorillibacterium massiliense]|uniref:transglutaminase-like domain-containing protein n=1 Tax=Gorillibacterium massiliense TaxID=1280390 RepID=UPI0004B3FFCB|nr:transglutaminase-like domain-containing protein [Gorillibacterium massiliense]
MYKKSTLGFLIFAFLFIIASTVFAGDGPVFDKSGVNGGVIRIQYDTQSDAALKVVIQKQNTAYTYDFKSGDRFPLQLGNGDYSVSVLQQASETKYKVVVKEPVTVKLANPNDVFLQSNKMINFDDKMAAVKKAKELTKNAKTEQEKVSLLYDYITKTIVYDDKKIKTLSNNYIPVIDNVLADGKGICYDYSTLFAAMLRSLNIPTKLMMGYKKDISVYHAWNQVYLKDKGKWVTIDTTYDATLRQNKAAVSMIKEDSQFKIEKVY